jgi:hypothetical protein
MKYWKRDVLFVRPTTYGNQYNHTISLVNKFSAFAVSDVNYFDKSMKKYLKRNQR